MRLLHRYRESTIAEDSDVFGAGVEIGDLTVTYGDGSRNVTAVSDFSLSIGAGDFVSLIGPSGCGKTTILHVVGGLVTPSHGDVAIGGRSPRELLKAGRIGLVLQDAALLPWRSVESNIRLLRELRGDFRKEDAQAVSDLIALTGLEGFEHAKPATLSGGMKQRVSIARALTLSPALLLMDEPFAALDEITRRRMGAELTRIWQARQSTVVFVTHSLEEALFLSDRVVLLSARPARIAADVRVEFPRPRLPELRSDERFLQQLGRLSAELERVSAGTAW